MVDGPESRGPCCVSATLWLVPGPHLAPQHSPSWVEASTTLQGMFLRWPMMTSSTKDLSPSSSTARTAGHKYFSTRWPTLGLTELLPSFACRRRREGQDTLWRPSLALVPVALCVSPLSPPSLSSQLRISRGRVQYAGQSSVLHSFLPTFTPGSRLVPKWATIRSTAVFTAFISPARKNGCDGSLRKLLAKALG